MTTEVQYWLAELSQHGNPTLIDGPHDNPEEVGNALGIFKVCGFIRDRKFACAKVELTAVEPAEVEDSPIAAMCRARQKWILATVARKSHLDPCRTGL